MGGCFGDSPVDRWIESQVDAYCGGKAFRQQRRLSLVFKQQLDNLGLDESDILEDLLDEVEDE